MKKIKHTSPRQTGRWAIGALLGKTSGATLSVTWYITSDSGDEKLFEHQIPVKSHDRAFSIGKNSGGMLSADTYKVVATLEGQTTDMEFDVAPLSTPGNKTSTGRNEKVFENQPRFTNNDRGYSVTKDPDGLLAASKYGLFANLESGRLKASLDASSQTASPTPTGSPGAEGKPPVQGTSGTVPQSEIGPGGCYLSGGSDLPGTKVLVTSSVKDSSDQTKEIGSVNATFTLADDTLAPRA